MFRIQTCCNHILSAAEGFRGQETTCADPGIFVSFYLVLSLFYSLKRGSNGFIAEKNILILYQGSKCGPLYSGGGGGGPTFSRGEGPNANFYRNPYTYFLFSRGMSGPPIPTWIRTWAMSSYCDNIYHSPASNHNCQALICQD